MVGSLQLGWTGRSRTSPVARILRQKEAEVISDQYIDRQLQRNRKHCDQLVCHHCFQRAINSCCGFKRPLKPFVQGSAATHRYLAVC